MDCGRVTGAIRLLMGKVYRMWRVECCVPTVIIVLLASTSSLAGQPESQDSTKTNLAAEVIVERALERMAAQDESGIELKLSSVGRSQTDSIDGDGRVTKTETTRYLRYPLEGHLYDEVIEKNGLPLDEDGIREELQRKEKFTREARTHAARGEEFIFNEMAIAFDRELMVRYNTRLSGNEMVRNYSCWVIDFEPKDGRLPDNRRMDKALNRSTGTLWISKKDFGVVRVAFEMQEPFRYLWGLAASLRHADGRLDFKKISPGVWAPLEFDLKLDLRVFFKGIRRHIRQTWHDYKLLHISAKPKPVDPRKDQPVTAFKATK